jgi:hypothetical protein
MTVETITLEEFHRRCRAQGMDRENVAFVCPACKTAQSIASFKAAKVNADQQQIEMWVGFSCVGRHTGAGAPRKEPDGEPCNWTLGGLLQIHELEVTDSHGVIHKCFRVATKEEAKALKEALS